jgi:hypothetical protein
MNLLKLITPTNIAEERDRFFASESYNPVFQYKHEDTKCISTVITQKENIINAVLKQDDEELVKRAKQYFETDLEKFSDEAQNIITQTQPSPISFNFDEFNNLFNKANIILGTQFSLKVVDQHGFNIRPNYKTRELFFSKHAHFDFYSARSEIQHEFAHIIRYINHIHNKLLHYDSYLPTEEGLATLMSDSVKGTNYSEFQHAMEYLASGIGSKGSLRDIYNFFAQHGFSHDLAWQRSIRHKFGFTDTSKPGDIIKPAMYFAHSRVIAKLPNEHILKLFQGRIPLDAIADVKGLTGKITEDKILNFFDYFN